jgi:hypothetical protein
MNVPGQTSKARSTQAPKQQSDQDQDSAAYYQELPRADHIYLSMLAPIFLRPVSQG